jgi:hypothetical protein
MILTVRAIFSEKDHAPHKIERDDNLPPARSKVA